jgi:endonuclease YncB( thermonuclease family)
MSITRSRWDLLMLDALLTIMLTGACAHPRERGSASASTPNGHLGFVSGVPAGDALYVALGNGHIETVRYVGIRTPEILHPTLGREPYEEIARAANSRLVEGKWVTLILDAQPRDRHGQLLAYVYVGNRFVNAELVHQGYAEAATYPPNDRYQEYFLGLERGARAAGRGFWADRAAQAYYRPRPSDQETEVGGSKSFLFVGPAGGGSQGTSGAGSPPPGGSPSSPNVSAPGTTSRGGTYSAPSMRGRR